MCGISGVINKQFLSVSPDEIKIINDLIAHRGPDDEGYFFGENFSLGHRRLSILDLSSDGHQPMMYMDKYVITYNGEIYNYVEIKDELLLDGYHFNSKTDTEVILAAYDKWGFDCVRKFNGMWSFSIHDKEKDILFCSRDRFGIKPFYYSDAKNKFIFGSEIKQILCGRGSDNFANMSSVRDFLIEGYSEHTAETFFDGVHNLPAGHNLIYSLKKNSFKKIKYYELDADLDLFSLNESSAVERFLFELKRSINYRLRSDVKVGTCLSGGLDSSSIACLASKIYNRKSQVKFQAIHARSTERELDESSFAQDLASSCNIDMCIIEPTVEEFIKSIDEVTYCQEEPFASPSVFMQYFVFKKAKEIGCKVMLDGQGGDEILLGYERYYPAYFRSIPIFDAIKEFFLTRRNSGLSIKELFGYFLYFSFSNIRILILKKKFSYIKDEYLKTNWHVTKSAESYLNIRKMQKLEIEYLQLPHLLRYEDKNSMRHSIEARLPFLDYKLVETSLSINNSLKIKDGWSKYILRIAMTGLMPKNILWRKIKLGFAAPEVSWIKEMSENMESTINKSTLLKNILKHELNFKKIDIRTFWRLYSIAKWEAIYSVKFLKK